jgi:hypothetical protein
MQKHKFTFCLIFVILFLSSNLLALAGNIPPHSRRTNIEPKSMQTENSLTLQKESKAPLTPDLWLAHLKQKISEPEAGTGTISGRVTQAPGGTTPIENVYIYADKLYCPYYYTSVLSDPDGYYVIDNLPEGIYWVSTDNDSIFLDLYWNNQPLWGEPDTVTVVSNDTTPNINFSLPIGGKITGKVTMPGANYNSLYVNAKDTLTHNYYSGYVELSPDTASYEIRRLPSGTFKVFTSESDSFVNEYYNDKPDWVSANPVAVTLGSTTPGINFTLALGGKITGTVTLPGASDVWVYVYARNTSTGTPYGVTAYNFDGNSTGYTINGLPTGTYKVYTSNYQGYLDEFYNDKPNESSADLVSVTAGSTHSNVNFTLTLGGVIKGNVTSSAKGSLEDIPVYAYSTTTYINEGIGITDASGDYRIDGLATGYYKILAYGDSIYADEYFNNKTLWYNADSVLVTAADSVSGKNFSLDVGGSISGYVYGDGGVPLSESDVAAFGLFDEATIMRSTTTHADGSYKISGLRTGYYEVLASIECDYMWFDNKTYYDIPDSVLVTMPDTTSGVNFNFPSSVGDDENQSGIRPDGFNLSQNYPNPFNPTTVIEYTLQKKARVNLEIYNLLGQKVKTLVNEYQSPGSYQIFWDGRNEQEQTVATGMYFYKFSADGVSKTKKMILLK